MTGHQPEAEQLEAQLRALGDDLLAGSTPDLRSGVRDRIATAGARPRRRGRSRRGTIAAIVATAVISGTTAAAVASPDVRSRLNNLIHFHGIEISRQSDVPTTSATPAPRRALGLGTPVSFAAAQRAATFRIQQPTRLGDPGSVLLLHPAAGAIVTLVYRPSAALPRSPQTGTGALLTEFAGAIDQIVFRKTLLGMAHTKETSVNGAPAIWAEGPQELFIVSANIDPYGLTPRLSANSLIWAANGVTYRLEADLPLNQVRRIAESVQ